MSYSCHSFNYIYSMCCCGECHLGRLPLPVYFFLLIQRKVFKTVVETSLSIVGHIHVKASPTHTLTESHTFFFKWIWIWIWMFSTGHCFCIGIILTEILYSFKLLHKSVPHVSYENKQYFGNSAFIQSRLTLHLLCCV